MDSGEHAEQKQGSTMRGWISVFVMVALVALATIALRTFVFVPYEIPSGSMEETIMTGDMVFSEKVSYYLRAPQRGDIVTFDDPEVAGRTLIKRVIATGGQTVDLVDGKVVVDGVALDEPYTLGKESRPLAHTAELPVHGSGRMPVGHGRQSDGFAGLALFRRYPGEFGDGPRRHDLLALQRD